MMSNSDVLEVIEVLGASSIDVWLDGGWGVDALLEEQTRPHDDLDVVVKLADIDVITDTLAKHGFAMSENELPTRFVVRDSNDRRIDFHPVTFDETGGGLQRQPDGTDYRYPPEGFLGKGKVGGKTVNCLSAEVQMECHTGYEPDDNDRHDVQALHSKFGIPMPNIYAKQDKSHEPL